MDINCWIGVVGAVVVVLAWLLPNPFNFGKKKVNTPPTTDPASKDAGTEDHVSEPNNDEQESQNTKIQTRRHISITITKISITLAVFTAITMFYNRQLHIYQSFDSFDSLRLNFKEEKILYKFNEKLYYKRMGSVSEDSIRVIINELDSIWVELQSCILKASKDVTINGSKKEIGKEEKR